MDIRDIREFVRTCDRDTYELFAQKGNEPSAESVAEFEKTLGFSIPADLREYLLHPLGGLYLGVKEELWPRPKEFAVGPFWMACYGLLAYSLSAEAPPWMSMRAAWEDMKAAGYPELLPVLKIISDPDPYCLTRTGGLVIWRHEEPDEPETVTGGFFDALMGEIARLEERKNRLLRTDSIA